MPQSNVASFINNFIGFPRMALILGTLLIFIHILILCDGDGGVGSGWNLPKKEHGAPSNTILDVRDRNSGHFVR